MNDKFELTIHTASFDGTQSDEGIGHDWTIYKNGIPYFYEGRDQMTLGEARKFTELLNKIGDCREENWPGWSVSYDSNLRGKVIKERNSRK